MRKLVIILCLCLCTGALMVGCNKAVPSKPSESSEVVPPSPFDGIDTKSAVFERIGEVTYPIDYVMSGAPGDYKLRDGIYYSLYLTNKLSPPAKSLDEFSEYVAQIARISLREYKKVFAEEKTLDGCQSFYVEGYGKDSNKYKYVVFTGILTDNGMTVMSAVINEEDWETKGTMCKAIMTSFKNNGMVDPSTLKEVLKSHSLKPSLALPSSWKLIKNEDNTKFYKNPTNSIEFTVFFGKQDDASLNAIMSNNAVIWETSEKEIQGFNAIVATGQYTPEVVASSSEESSSSKPKTSKTSSSEPEEPRVPAGTMEYYAYEITQNGYRCIVVAIIRADVVTDPERQELEKVLADIQLYEKTEPVDEDILDRAGVASSDSHTSSEVQQPEEQQPEEQQPEGQSEPPVRPETETNSSSASSQGSSSLADNEVDWG